MGRNTPILQEIVDVLFTELDEQATALTKLETYFQHRLLINVGDIAIVGSYAEQLRLNITSDEGLPLMHAVADQTLVGINIDHVEQVVWDLFGNRSVQP